MRYLILVFTFFTAFAGKAQQIEFAINAPDTAVFMARYFGPKLYYADTAQLVKGKLTYDGSKHPGGLYALILPNGKPFDFIIDGEPSVKMKVNDLNNPVPTMDVIKSENNKIFFEYMRFMNDRKQEGKELNEQMANASGEEKEAYRNKLQDLNDRVKAYQQKIADENPEKFIGIMVKMSIEPELPEHPRDENGVITDSNYVYHYFIEHYWDNVDLKDYRIVNAPIFHNRLDKYFSRKGILQIPDTICHYATKLIDQTDKVDQNNKVFQYVVHHVTNKYETSKIMGMDKVFCYMAQNYYCPPNNLAYWMTEENTQKVCERAEKVCRLVIGNFAPVLILPDSTEEKWISTNDIDAEYTVLYFWDPNCGHCKKITPKLQTLYEKKLKERGIEVYAIGKATGEDFDKWKEYIVDNELSFINVGITPTVYEQATTDPLPLLKHTTVQSLNYADTYDVYSTPRIFILDKDKRILFKQISIGQLEEILDKRTGHEADEKLFPMDDPENATGQEPVNH